MIYIRAPCAGSKKAWGRGLRERVKNGDIIYIYLGIDIGTSEFLFAEIYSYLCIP